MTDIVISSGARKGIKRAMFGKSTAGRVTSVRKAATRITQAALARARAPARKRYSSGAMANARTGGFLGLELKFVDYSLSAFLVAPGDAAGGEADPATALCLNAIAQGDGENQRDGRQAIVKSCYVAGNINVAAEADETDAHTSRNYYVALVMDTQTNGAQLNSEDVFTNPGAAATQACNVLRDMQYTQRFKVLDSVVLVSPPQYVVQDGAATGSISGYTIPFKLSWNGEMKVSFSGTTAAISAIQDNTLHIIAYASPNITQAPAIIYNSRVRFVG